MITFKRIIQREPLMVRAILAAVTVAILEGFGVDPESAVQSVTGLSIDSVILAVAAMFGLSLNARKQVAPANEVY